MSEIPKEVEAVRNEDMSPAMMARASAPKKTWFFERMGDGMVFACEEKEAWDICFNKSNWKRRDFKLLGTSDGKTYAKITKESMAQARKLEPLIEKKKTELQRYMTAEEKLVVDEAVDMEGDPSDAENEANKRKVERLRGIMDRLHAELDAMEEEYRSLVSNVVKRATDAELAVAKKNFKKYGPEWPDEAANLITPEASGRQRDKILGIMNGRR